MLIFFAPYETTRRVGKGGTFSLGLKVDNDTNY